MAPTARVTVTLDIDPAALTLTAAAPELARAAPELARAALTPEQRSERTRKSNATRRAKAAKTKEPKQ